MKQYFQLDIADKKYRSVLLLSYTMIAVLTVMTLISGIFLWFNSHTRKIIYDMSTVQLRNLDTIVSNSLNMYRIQLQTAWQDVDVRQYIYAGVKNWKNEYLMGNYFVKMCVNNGIADYVCLFKGNEFQYYGPYYPEEKERSQIETQILETVSDMQHFFIESDSGGKLCVFLTERSNVGAKPQSGIVYSLNLTRMERQLIAQENIDSVFLAFSSDGYPVLTGKLAEKDLDRIRKRVIGNGKMEQNQAIDINGSAYLCNYLYSDATDMYFVLIQDYQVLQQQMQGILGVSAICVIGSLLMALSLAVFLTNRFYYPLEEFFSKLRMGAILPGDEDYSKKQAEITSEKIISQFHMMSWQYHSDEVLGFLNGEEDEEIPLALRLSDRAEEGRFLLFWTSERVLNRKLMERLIERMEENLSGCKLASFYDSRASWMLLLLKEPIRVGRLTDTAWTVEQIRDVIADLPNEEGIEIYYAISETMDNEKELRPNFRELQTLQKYHLLGQSSAGMEAAQFEKRRTEEISPKIYDDYLNAVRKGKVDEAEKLLPYILDTLSGFEVHKILMSLAEFCVLLEQSIRGMEMAGRQRQEKCLEYYIRLTALYDRQDLEAYLKRLTEDVCLENSVYQEKTLRMNMLDAVEYIRAHYRDDSICVDQVAEQFHMSVSYFSKLFNEYVGMTFPEFINDLRLTYAKELLLANRDINIKRVAEMCGFSTTSYFSQQFKKKFGISPSSVRNK